MIKKLKRGIIIFIANAIVTYLFCIFIGYVFGMPSFNIQKWHELLKLLFIILIGMSLLVAILIVSEER